ncbi:MAG: SWIM zinc finger family protein [Chloroflexi bacterium]|nr:SWIM zinc finger family protein [Chloroflexota bacterium]
MSFDPATLPQLTSLGQRLQKLAGDSAYKAGRDYLRKGHVKDGSVAPGVEEPAAFALVSGSTDYRVSVRLPAADEARVTCTCPAHRRNKFCKHVVAVCAALLEQPAAFSVLDSLPEPPAPAARKKTSRAGGASKTKVEPAAQRAAGLDVLDRLLLELTDGGLMALGAEKSQLIAQCGELVRALKLRRLGNLLMQLQRAVADSQGIDAATFTSLLLDLYRCRTATGAMLDGSVALDPRLAEDLLGKTWRAEELEPVADLELVQVATTQESDGEFLVATSYLADLASLTIYVDRVIAPRRLRGTEPPNHRLRLLVRSAGLYPGLAPRRIKLAQYERATLRSEHLDRLVQGAASDVTEIQRRLIERAASPFGQPEAAVLFRPSALLTAPEGTPGLATTRAGAPAGALDRSGQFLALDWSALAVAGLELAPPPDDPFALFGIVTPTAFGPRLRPLSVVGMTPRSTGRGSYGRIFPG